MTCIAVVLLCSMLLGAYTFYDKNSVHQQASSDRWSSYKPTNNTRTFEQLQAINTDVKGWIQYYGTGIDYPVMYSRDEWYYFYHNPLKQNSLSGSIYIDSQNSPDFSDVNTILHGHKMDKHAMFGDVGLFKKSDYFYEHRYGDLYYSGVHHGIQSIGYVEANAYDSSVYSIIRSGSLNNYLANLKSKSIVWDNDVDLPAGSKILLLSTCKNQETDLRCILVCKICDNTFDNPFANTDLGTGTDPIMGIFEGLPWLGWLILLGFLVLFFLYMFLSKHFWISDIVEIKDTKKIK